MKAPAVALKQVVKGNGHSPQLSLLDPASAFYVDSPQLSPDMTPAVTGAEAIHDLPALTQH